MDKLESNLCIRLPLKLKAAYQCLDDVRKKKVHQAIMVAIAAEIHSAEFDPEKYGIKVEA